jgi:hypothetical protein
MSKNGRVKVLRSYLHHILQKDSQRALLMPLGNSTNMNGTIKSGSTQKGWIVTFDCFPWEKICSCNEKEIHFLPVGNEEPVCDHMSQFDAEKAVKRKRKKSL